MKLFLSTTSLAQVLIFACSVRFLILGAHTPEAVYFLALAGLEGLRQYIASHKKDSPIPLNDQILTEVAELKSAVQALKMGRIFGK